MSLLFAATAASRVAPKSVLRRMVVARSMSSTVDSSWSPIPVDVEHYTSGWNVTDIQGTSRLGEETSIGGLPAEEPLSFGFFDNPMCRSH